jgi:pilus assembly protein CpaB
MDRRKKLMVFGVAWLSALFLTWFLYANTVAPKTEKEVRIAVAARDMQLGALLRPNDIKLVNHLERDVPKGAIFDSKVALNRVLLVPISTNEPILASKLSAVTSAEGVSSTIDPGYRAVSVPVTDANGVAGLILPNSRVDVLFTRTGSLAEASTTIILQNVKVLSTGHAAASGQTADPRAPRSPVVTLVLSPGDAAKLELAKNQGKIGLSLRNPLDQSTAAATGPLTADALDPTLESRIAKARQARNPAPAKAAPDPKMWEELARKAQPKKEEKPAAIVDVYHGDKHVQESFR